MIRSSILLTLLATLAAPEPVAEEEYPDILALRIGQQVSGPRLVRDDLEGRVVLVYNWCVS